MKCYASFFVSIYCILIVFQSRAQAPQVPHKMHFADLTLTIRDDARKEIQKDVDAMTLSPKHFNIKVERAKTYFPIIEKVFAEENVPDDFKYLVLQESALIADAISPSNAVGFWQFKDFTAIEMGLRVDKEIDERMNIVSASRGAARYFKKNNMFFDNWLYALQAYQMGAGAVLQTVKDSKNGVKHMEITSKTYWYVKKFLAHKIAFEDAVKGPGQVQVTTFENNGRRSLGELAREMSIDETTLKSNNKWVKKGIIPDDRPYMVLVPVAGNGTLKMPTALPLNVASNARAGKPQTTAIIKNSKINGLLTIVAVPGDTPSAIAARGGVELPDFLKWNDISITDPIQVGQVYFLAKKRSRAMQAYHHVKAGEDLWLISQQYGVQLKKLRKYNRLETNAIIKLGQTLWLSSKRPKEGGVNESTPVVEVSGKETFNWTVDESASTMVATTKAADLQTAQLEAAKTEGTGVKQDSVQHVEASDAKQAERLHVEAPDSASVVVHVEAPEPENAGQTAREEASEIKREHIVQPKETLYAIAHLYNVGVMDLVNWNNLNIQEAIKPGQHLKLYGEDEPEKDVSTAKGEPEQLFHEVKTTDTLYSVARKYGVTIKELMDWNGKKDFNLTVGEKLKILRH